MDGVQAHAVQSAKVREPRAVKDAAAGAARVAARVAAKAVVKVTAESLRFKWFKPKAKNVNFGKEVKKNARI